MKHYEVKLYREVLQEMTVTVIADDHYHALDKSRDKALSMDNHKWKEINTKIDCHSIKELDMFDEEG